MAIPVTPEKCAVLVIRHKCAMRIMIGKIGSVVMKRDWNVSRIQHIVEDMGM